MRRSIINLGLAALLSICGFLAPVAVADDIPNRVYELTTFTTPDGKLGELKTQFRNHVTRLMLVNGMQVVGLWTPRDEARSGNTLIVMVSHESLEAASAAWQDVEKEPEWKKLIQVDEPLVISTEKTYLSATDFSPMK